MNGSKNDKDVVFQKNKYVKGEVRDIYSENISSSASWSFQHELTGGKPEETNVLHLKTPVSDSGVDSNIFRGSFTILKPSFIPSTAHAVADLLPFEFKYRKVFWKILGYESFLYSMTKKKMTYSVIASATGDLEVSDRLTLEAFPLDRRVVFEEPFFVFNRTTMPEWLRGRNTHDEFTGQPGTGVQRIDRKFPGYQGESRDSQDDVPDFDNAFRPRRRR